MAFLAGIIGRGLGLVGELLGGEDGKVAEAVKTISGAVAGSSEVQEKLQAIELEEKKLWVQENADIRKLFAGDSASEDTFVRRARPAALWLALALLAVNFILIPLFNTVASYFGHTAAAIAYPALPEELYWLVGSLFGLYTGARSWDKKNKNKRGGE